MRRPVKIVSLVLLVAVLAGVGLLVRTLRYGFSARDEPTAIEAFLARTMRHYAVPADLRGRKNPVVLTAEVLTEGRAHFADHCASCHGNDGRGSELGRSFYPKAPDMTLAQTQGQGDGELFATIENGIRLTGMPAWGNGTADSAAATWALVHFIRHLPQITPEELREMEKLNPVSPSQTMSAEDEERFLAGEDEPPGAPPPAGHHHSPPAP
jgi:mono/diheme cytochrome c family protein